MPKVMEIIEKETKGKSYHTYKYSYDSIGLPSIDYDDDPNKVMKWKDSGETDSPKGAVDLKHLADQLQQLGETPLLKYFLDGSRHVFKVDDIAYNKQVFPVVAGQIGVGCCRRENKRMQKERFYRELVLALPDKANADGWDDAAYFAAKVKKLNESEELKFTTSYLGESIKSIMTCDAQKMRAMLVENKKYTLDEIWDAIVAYTTDVENENEHYFEVEMFDINKENTDLLDDAKVREYLSFVAPVPYKNTFILRNQIYDYANSIGYHIDEYCVRVNGSQIFKEYTTKLKEQSGAALKNYDEISRLEFKDFRDNSGNLIAWMWIGLSRFEKQIPSINHMRGLRVRSANIQLGNDDALQPLFKENRGNYYFVGEVFAASRNLIPNSQRNYFNENETRVLFEDLLREYFFDVLHKLYYEANRVKNDYKRQEEYLSKVAEYQKKEQEKGFVNEEERQKLQFDIDRAKKSAEEARKRLDKLDSSDSASPLSEVRKSIGKKYAADALKKKAETTTVATNDDDKKKPFVTTGMSKLSRSERKLVGKILSIITDIAPKDIAEQIITKIKEEMR